MLISATTLNQVGQYAGFAEIGRACLATTAAKADKRLPAKLTLPLPDT